MQTRRTETEPIEPEPASPPAPPPTPPRATPAGDPPESEVTTEDPGADWGYLARRRDGRPLARWRGHAVGECLVTPTATADPGRP